ncbi:hypothetical protein LEN26_003983 [Aphanomyces euteiches]|nr:hypothetical protein AeMF1_006812 [Aphanomyces euteiches]KAH9150891.1 hypothetical protein LEN26_003983 [Aphanomyces euteiches]
MKKWAEEDLRAQRKRDGIGERELPVEVTPSGIPGWHLNTPSSCNSSRKCAIMKPSWYSIQAGTSTVASRAGSWLVPLNGNVHVQQTTKDTNATLEGDGTFGTATVFGCAFHAGKWYYEVELLTDGVIQHGWADASFEADDEEGDGVGDHVASWAYDGCREVKWTNGVSATFGSKWVAGNIIGCWVDIDTIGFARNGVDMGVAFTDVRPSEKSESTYGDLFLAFSLEAKERIRINIGDHTFAFKTKNDALAVLAIVPSEIIALKPHKLQLQQKSRRQQ